MHNTQKWWKEPILGMYATMNKTILVNETWHPGLEEDDLSTLSGSTDPSFSHKSSRAGRKRNPNQPSNPIHANTTTSAIKDAIITPGTPVHSHCNRKTKDKLQSYISSTRKELRITATKNPSSVPFDEVPMAVRLDLGLVHSNNEKES